MKFLIHASSYLFFLCKYLGSVITYFRSLIEFSSSHFNFGVAEGRSASDTVTGDGEYEKGDGGTTSSTKR